MNRCCPIIQIDDKLVDSSILSEYFHCDLSACHGACCHEGSEGAPLTAEEIVTIEEHIHEILPTLSPQGRAAVESEGVAYRDPDGEWVTQLQPNADCVFAVHCHRMNSLLCAIEQADKPKNPTGGTEDIRRELHKPISCALYPIRTARSGAMTLLRYDRWHICEPARRLGKRKRVKVYQFLQTPLVRAYGSEFYQQLTEAEHRLEKEQ